MNHRPCIPAQHVSLHPVRTFPSTSGQGASLFSDPSKNIYDERKSLSFGFLSLGKIAAVGVAKICGERNCERHSQRRGERRVHTRAVPQDLYSSLWRHQVPYIVQFIYPASQFYICDPPGQKQSHVTKHRYWVHMFRIRRLFAFIWCKYYWNTYLNFFGIVWARCWSQVTETEFGVSYLVSLNLNGMINFHGNHTLSIIKFCRGID